MGCVRERSVFGETWAEPMKVVEECRVASDCNIFQTLLWWKVVIEISNF